MSIAIVQPACFETPNKRDVDSAPLILLVVATESIAQQVVATATSQQVAGSKSLSLQLSAGNRRRVRQLETRRPASTKITRSSEDAYNEKQLYSRCLQIRCHPSTAKLPAHKKLYVLPNQPGSPVRTSRGQGLNQVAWLVSRVSLPQLCTYFYPRSEIKRKKEIVVESPTFVSCMWAEPHNSSHKVRFGLNIWKTSSQNQNLAFLKQRREFEKAVQEERKRRKRRAKEKNKRWFGHWKRREGEK